MVKVYLLRRGPFQFLSDGQGIPECLNLLSIT
jgi:hypothetical protein